MGITISKAVETDLAGICKLGKEIGFSLPAGRTRKYILSLDPSLQDDGDNFFGVTAKDDHGEIVGYYGVTPCELIINGVTVRGYQGGPMCVKPGHGMLIFQILTAIKKQVASTFLIGNTSGAESTALLDRFFKVEHGPQGCAFIRFSILNWMSFSLAFLVKKLHFPLLIAHVLDALVQIPRKLFYGRREGTGKVVPKNFSDPRFVSFWNRFREGNSRLCLSRNPKRLQWIFDAHIASGDCCLICVCNGDEIGGFSVLGFRHWAHSTRCEVLDWCAIDNNKEILRELLDKSLREARRRGACVIEYVGSPSSVDDVIDAIFTRKRHAASNVATWFTSRPDVADALRNNYGWFFGPYDGDRCMF